MALTYQDVAEVDLSKLGNAVADWKKAVSHLRTLEKEARSGMLAKSESARWAGVNATVTRAFVKKTAKEFADAYAEAATISALLSDAHTELVKIQKSIQQIVADQAKLGVTLQDIGGGAVRWTFPRARSESGDGERTTEQLEAAQALADRIPPLVNRAYDIDTSVAQALGRAHGNATYNFGHATYKSLDAPSAPLTMRRRRGGRWIGSASGSAGT